MDGEIAADTAGPVDLLIWDADLKGFGLRVKPSGHRAYVYRYRDAAGRERRLTVECASAQRPEADTPNT